MHVLCQTLRLLEGYNLKEMGHLSPDYVHVLTEALKLGMADRDAYYGDPVYADVPIEALLSDEYTALRQPLSPRSSNATLAPSGDTAAGSSSAVSLPFQISETSPSS